MRFIYSSCLCSNLSHLYFYSSADANTILHKLQKHKFPEHKWMNLATGLMLGSRVPGIVSENSSDLSRLIALVNHWTANSDEGSRGETETQPVAFYSSTQCPCVYCLCLLSCCDDESFYKKV